MARAESTGASGRIDHGSGSIHALLTGVVANRFPCSPNTDSGAGIRGKPAGIAELRPADADFYRLEPSSPETWKRPKSGENETESTIDHGFRRVWPWLLEFDHGSQNGAITMSDLSVADGTPVSPKSWPSPRRGGPGTPGVVVRRRLSPTIDIVHACLIPHSDRHDEPLDRSYSSRSHMNCRRCCDLTVRSRRGSERRTPSFGDYGRSGGAGAGWVGRPTLDGAVAGVRRISARSRRDLGLAIHVQEGRTRGARRRLVFFLPLATSGARIRS